MKEKVLKKTVPKELKTLVDKLKLEPGISALQAEQAQIYLVGGIVRDAFMNKESKDIDILVAGIPIERISEILTIHGKVDLVGVSFGIIKYKTTIDDVEDTIDIAIPRTEIKTGRKHTDFKVVADHTLPITTDLQRRDFTINAIAYSFDHEIIDPFNGVKDCEDRVLSVVSKKSFLEDPLRLLRGIQFTSRFGLYISNDTKALYTTSRYNLDAVSGERIRMELEKIISKGCPKLAVDAFIQTKLHIAKYGTQISRFDHNEIGDIETIPQLLLVLYNYNVNHWTMERYTSYFGLTNKETKELKFYSSAMLYDSNFRQRVFIFEALKDLPHLLSTKFFEGTLEVHNRIVSSRDYSWRENVLGRLKNNIDAFNIKCYPRELNEINIDGFDLMDKGLIGKQIGDAYKRIVSAIVNDKLSNNKEDIMAYLDL